MSSLKSVKYVLFLAILIISIPVFGATGGKIKGQIIDKETGQPLSGVNVIIQEAQQGAATDADGLYIITNIDPGVYTVKASYIGYTTVKKTQVRITSGYTTTIDFELESTPLEGETITVVAERPPIQKDRTSSEHALGSEQIESAPIEELSELVELQAGIKMQPSRGFVAGAPGDGMHIRGGRSGETLFLIDGVRVGNELYGGSQYIQNTSGSGVEEMKTIIGTFNAEYGGKTGGVISISTSEGSDEYHGMLKGYTDNFGIDPLDRNTYQSEFSLSGPVPILPKLTFYANGQIRTTDGRPDMYGVEIPNWSDSEGQVGIDSTYYYSDLTKDDPDYYGGGLKGKKIPGDWSDQWNGMGKLTYRPGTNLKFMLTYLHSWERKSDYQHDYRFRPHAFPWSKVKNNGAIGKFVHTLSNRSFYEVMVSYQKTNFFYGIHEIPEAQDLYGRRITSGEYYFSGATRIYNTDTSETWQASFNLSNQINNNHQIKTGLQFRYIDAFHRQDMAGGEFGRWTIREWGVVDEVDNPSREMSLETAHKLDAGLEIGDTYIDSTLYENHISYVNRQPIEFSAYIQDKMEFETIGMIMNLGVRFEYWNPRMEYMENPKQPPISELQTENPLKPPYPKDEVEAKMKETEPKIRISPRFGISYPISDKAAFHLAYGHFYQLPKYMELLSGLNDRGINAGGPNLTSEGPGISNPNADPEKTVSYETGVQLQISDDISFDVTAYYREMTDLMGVRWIDAVTTQYVYLNNVDYGNSKGLEFTLKKQFSDFWAARIFYTWSTSKISTSSPFTAAQKNRFLAYQTYTADWDRPHDISAYLLFGVPDDWRVSLIQSARSGQPYTVMAETPNTERMPWEIRTDLRASKTFHFFNMNETVYIQVYNLFNIRNVRDVYSETGKWDDDGLNGTPPDVDAEPGNISDGIRARLGLKINF
jgi:hypothetical protein